MNLKIKDLIGLLKVSEDTIQEWIDEKKIPFYKIGGIYRFSESEINEWILNNKLKNKLQVSQKIIDLSASRRHVSLTEILQRSGIFYSIEGKNVLEIIQNCVKKITLPQDLTEDVLLESLIEREDLMPTAIGKGLAIPHPRSPIITEVENESLSICFLKEEINYDAIDGIKVHTLFIVLSANPKRHLEILSKISFLAQNDDFMNLLKTRAEKEKIVDFLTQQDRVWLKV